MATRQRSELEMNINIDNNAIDNEIIGYNIEK
jgi:hypothetical protein